MAGKKTARKSRFERLRDKRKPLTAAERKRVMDANAVWHHGQNGAPAPAVWKSEDSKGNPVYVTNTHRAFNTAPTVEGAIRRFHDFIKGTA